MNNQMFMSQQISKIFLAFHALDVNTNVNFRSRAQECSFIVTQLSNSR